MELVIGVMSLVLLRIYKLWKWLLHLFTGQSELERICLGSSPQYHKTILLETALARASIGSELRQRVLSIEPDTDLDSLVRTVAAAKRIGVDKPHYLQFCSALLQCFEQMQSLAVLHRELDQAKQAYESSDAEHEALLLRLWAAFRPEVRLSARKSKDWGELGFQGMDPSTDFRGMGLLGLQNLVDFGERWPVAARGVLGDCLSHKNWFGLAITGINLTADVYTQTKSRRLNAYFYRQGTTMQAFTALYVHYVVRFNHLWAQRNPPNVMSFGEIHKDFLTNVLGKIDQGTLVVVGPEVHY